MHAATVLVTRNFTKSDEFRGNSARIPCGFRKASVQLTVELQFYFRGECLPFPRNDTSLSAKLTSSFFVERHYYIRMWRTSFALVASYNNGLMRDVHHMPAS